MAQKSRRRPATYICFAPPQRPFPFFKKITFMQYLSIFLVLLACNARQSTDAVSATAPAGQAVTTSNVMTMDSLVPPQYDQAGKLIRVEKSKEQWKKQLTAEEFYVLREEGTERAGSGDLLKNHDHGVFTCAGCGLPLFRSDTKFESGTGWPSFYQPIEKSAVNVGTDNSHGMSRDVVECARCGGHLGHVFDDGPQPTGQRYCMKSVSLNFVKQ